MCNHRRWMVLIFKKKTKSTSSLLLLFPSNGPLYSRSLLPYRIIHLSTFSQVADNMVREDGESRNVEYRGRRGIVLGLLRIPKRIPSIPIHRSKRIVGKFEEKWLVGRRRSSDNRVRDAGKLPDYHRRQNINVYNISEIRRRRLSTRPPT